MRSTSCKPLMPGIYITMSIQHLPIMGSILYFLYLPDINAYNVTENNIASKFLRHFVISYITNSWHGEAWRRQGLDAVGGGPLAHTPCTSPNAAPVDSP